MTGTLWWAIGAFGLGGVLLIGAGLVFGWPIIIGTRIGRMALAIAAGAAAVFGVYLKGRAEGAESVRKKQREASDRNREIASGEKERTEGRTDAEVRQRLKDRPK